MIWYIENKSTVLCRETDEITYLNSFEGSIWINEVQIVDYIDFCNTY